jgi:hypothetical protein
MTEREIKTCPLLAAGHLAHFGAYTAITDCIDSCAWWDKQKQQCAIMTIAQKK